MLRVFILICFLTFCRSLDGKEYHVSVKGSDSNPGTEHAPFRTIGKAAETAYAGDVITVYAGTYREWVNPPRGGTDADNRIVYRAAPGERVEIKGSERITSWEKVEGGVWKVTLPNVFFGNYNPYQELLAGDWFNSSGKRYHTGEVFLNDRSLYEKETLAEIENPQSIDDIPDAEGSIYVWYCEVDEINTTIWANFHDFNPNKELVEISVRPTCFYPLEQGVDYLTLCGFHISQAATQWAPPTAEQIGMVATHWNKGWIIENNVISNSKCTGITLGKERGTGHNVWSQMPEMDGALHYIEVIFRALRNGWEKGKIGSHIVRNNEIFACEQAGICGSMGAAFSLIENNYIHDIWVKRQFAGPEIAGIKLHAGIDTHVRHNRIDHCRRGIWMDWMTQGTWIERNLMYDNLLEDLFVEVSHGPYLVENNILGSLCSVHDVSQGGAYVHNLFAGSFLTVADNKRYTPYFLPHSTTIAGFSIIIGGDNRFYNNVFMPTILEEKKCYGLSIYDELGYCSYADGNIYYRGAMPLKDECCMIVDSAFQTKFYLEERGREVFGGFEWCDFDKVTSQLITTALLGKTKLAKASYECSDGSPITIDKDYFGYARRAKPTPGPFEQLKAGQNSWRLW